MQIGIKLDIGFAENDSYRRLFGGDDPLSLLWQAGVRAVETAVDPQTDFPALADYVDRCVDAGFLVSLHPYTERTPSNPGCFSRDDRRCRIFHSRVFLAAEETADRQGRGVIVNIHGAAGPVEEDRAQLLEESIRFFTWARKWCAENAPRVNPVAELQFRPWPEELIQRIGDRYEELDALVRRAEVGACWDLGHAYMNAVRYDAPLDPPEHFLTRVVHIHCHDVKEIDHSPLVFGRVPWKNLLGSAVEAGFDGTVVLEVPPEKFFDAGGFGSLAESVRKITAFAEAAAEPEDA